MARVRRALAPITLLVVALWMCCIASGQPANDSSTYDLREGFYSSSCPNVEMIVYKKMQEITQIESNTPADILRLHFHDCFVRGCDGSVLLDVKDSEKNAPSNDRLEAFESIDAIKAAVEEVCSGVVSCADILAFAARDGVRISGGPFWAVPSGRRDGRVSRKSEATRNLPTPQMNVRHLVANFRRQGLSKSDMVVLSGAHTIGDIACHHIDDRLYKYPSKSKVDPDIPSHFVSRLKKACPRSDLRTQNVDLDHITPRKFDTRYYHNLVQKKGVLASDQVLFNDTGTQAMVMENRDKAKFFKSFAEAMIRMSRIAPLTGSQGEIRKYCRSVNSQ